MAQVLPQVLKPEVQEEDAVHRVEPLLPVDQVVHHDDPLEHHRLDARLVLPKVVGLKRRRVEACNDTQAQLHRDVLRRNQRLDQPPLQRRGYQDKSYNDVCDIWDGG